MHRRLKSPPQVSPLVLLLEAPLMVQGGLLINHLIIRLQHHHQMVRLPPQVYLQDIIILEVLILILLMLFNTIHQHLGNHRACTLQSQ